MIRHIVMWKLKDKAQGPEMKAKLEGLVGKVPEVGFFQVGLNSLESETSRDIVLVGDFQDLDALQRYVVHPAHQEVAAFVKQVTEERRAVDFELP